MANFLRSPTRYHLLLAITVTLLGCAGDEDVPAGPSSRPIEATSEGPSVDDALQLFRSQNLEGAAGLLEQVTAREEDNSRAWQMLGMVRQRLGDLDAAVSAYGKAIELDPQRHAARYGTAAIHAIRGDEDQAFEILHGMKAAGEYDLSQITLDADLESLREDPRFDDLLMKPADFADPFVEETRIIHEWVGEAAGDAFGWIGRNVGDVDGDGIDDAVVSAVSKNVGGEQAGRVYAYSGGSGELLWQVSGEPGDRLGESVEAAGDVNADGTPDVIAGAPSADKVFVYSGRNGAVLLALAADQEGERLGGDVRGVGDVDGDGHGDVLVGAPSHDGGGEEAGRAALYSGKDGTLLKEWWGNAGESFGSTVAGSVRGDHDLLVIGASNAGQGDRGRVFVYNGLEDRPSFVIESDEQGSQLAAMFLSVIGDVDADGIPDVYASDWAHTGKGPSTGQIVVHSGADGSRLLALAGEEAGDGFGIGPADAGDVDGDGHDDLVVGAWQHGSGAPSGGKVYLHSGKDGSLIRTWTSKVMGETFGFDATGMGDVDGDGKIDFLLTSAWSAINGARSGRVFVLAGS